jgi:putative membrane protein
MSGLLFSDIPYCGTPPAPEAIWTRWNLDPVLVGVLILAAAFYGFAVWRLRGGPRALAFWRKTAFVVGWATLTLALISPLCPLSVSLFSARVGQHMILSLIAVPLIILGRPDLAAAALWPRVCDWLSGLGIVRFASGAPGATLAFTLAIWFWHAPGPYDATFASPLVYWLMHITVIGSALLVWSVLLDPAPQRVVGALAAGAFSTLQMTFLGALITMAPRPLYAPHAVTTYAWGLTQSGDQQLGGLIMWVPGCSIFLAVTLYTLARSMAERLPSDAIA